MCFLVFFNVKTLTASFFLGKFIQTKKIATSIISVYLYSSSFKANRMTNTQSITGFENLVFTKYVMYKHRPSINPTHPLFSRNATQESLKHITKMTSYNTNDQ